MSGAAAVGAACAVALWLLFPVSSPAALALGAGVALCAPSFFVAVTFLIAIAFSDRVPSASDVPYLLRALLTEVIDFNVAVAGMIASKPPISAPSAA